MINLVNRHRIWFKLVATVVVCLFTVNSIAWAIPERTISAVSQNLQVQSIFKPILDVGEWEPGGAHETQLRMEANVILSRILQAKRETNEVPPFQDINALIDEWYSYEMNIKGADRRGRKRLLNVTSNPKTGDGFIEVEVELFQKNTPRHKFVITVRNKDIYEKSFSDIMLDGTKTEIRGVATDYKDLVWPEVSERDKEAQAPEDSVFSFGISGEGEAAYDTDGKDGFVIGVGTFLAANSKYHPDLKISTEPGLTTCTGICVKAENEEGVYYGLGHLYLSGEGEKDRANLLSHVMEIRRELKKQGFKFENIEFFVDYRKESYMYGFANERKVREVFPKSLINFHRRLSGEDNITVTAEGVIVENEQGGRVVFKWGSQPTYEEEHIGGESSGYLGKVNIVRDVMYLERRDGKEEMLSVLKFHSPRGDREGIMMHRAGEALDRGSYKKEPLFMAYSIPTEKGSAERGLRGVFIRIAYRHKGFLRHILNAFFKLYPDVRRTHVLMENLMLQDILIREYGFKPEDPDIEPNAWIKFNDDEGREPGVGEIIAHFPNKKTEKEFRRQMPGPMGSQYLFADKKDDSFHPVYFGYALIVKDVQKFNEAMSAVPVKIKETPDIIELSGADDTAQSLFTNLFTDKHAWLKNLPARIIGLLSLATSAHEIGHVIWATLSGGRERMIDAYRQEAIKVIAGDIVKKYHGSTNELKRKTIEKDVATGNAFESQIKPIAWRLFLRDVFFKGEVKGVSGAAKTWGGVFAGNIVIGMLASFTWMIISLPILEAFGLYDALATFSLTPGHYFYIFFPLMVNAVLIFTEIIGTFLGRGDLKNQGTKDQTETLEDLNRRFKISELMGKYGHRINGGRNPGRAGADKREIPIVDFAKDKVLRDFYRRFMLNFYRNIIKEAGVLTFLKIVVARIKMDRSKMHLPGEIKGKLVRLAYDTVMEMIIYDGKYAEELGRKYRGKPVLIGDAAIGPRRGVCRHHGLVVAALLERLIQRGYIHGSVFYVRNTFGFGHGWAEYRDSRGTFYVLDVAQKYFGLKEGKYLGDLGEEAENMTIEFSPEVTMIHAQQPRSEERDNRSMDSGWDDNEDWGDNDISVVSDSVPVSWIDSFEQIWERAERKLGINKKDFMSFVKCFDEVSVEKRDVKKLSKGLRLKNMSAEEMFELLGLGIRFQEIESTNRAEESLKGNRSWKDYLRRQSFTRSHVVLCGVNNATHAELLITLLRQDESADDARGYAFKIGIDEVKRMEDIAARLYGLGIILDLAGNRKDVLEEVVNELNKLKEDMDDYLDIAEKFLANGEDNQPHYDAQNVREIYDNFWKFLSNGKLSGIDVKQKLYRFTYYTVAHVAERVGAFQLGILNYLADNPSGVSYDVKTLSRKVFEDYRRMGSYGQYLLAAEAETRLDNFGEVLAKSTETVQDILKVMEEKGLTFTPKNFLLEIEKNHTPVYRKHAEGTGRVTVKLKGKSTGMERFTGDILVTAGTYDYRFWLEGNEVKFKIENPRNQDKDKIDGSIHSFSQGKEFTVGRSAKSGSDFGDKNDEALSRRHFTIKVVDEGQSAFNFEVIDHHSAGGTRITWSVPEEEVYDNGESSTAGAIDFSEDDGDGILARQDELEDGGETLDADILQEKVKGVTPIDEDSNFDEVLSKMEDGIYDAKVVHLGDERMMQALASILARVDLDSFPKPKVWSENSRSMYELWKYQSLKDKEVSIAVRNGKIAGFVEFSFAAPRPGSKVYVEPAQVRRFAVLPEERTKDTCHQLLDDAISRILETKPEPGVHVLDFSVSNIEQQERNFLKEQYCPARTKDKNTGLLWHLERWYEEGLLDRNAFTLSIRKGEDLSREKKLSTLAEEEKRIPLVEKSIVYTDELGLDEKKRVIQQVIEQYKADEESLIDFDDGIDRMLNDWIIIVEGDKPLGFISYGESDEKYTLYAHHVFKNARKQNIGGDLIKEMIKRLQAINGKKSNKYLLTSTRLTPQGEKIWRNIFGNFSGIKEENGGKRIHLDLRKQYTFEPGVKTALPKDSDIKEGVYTEKQMIKKTRRLSQQILSSRGGIEAYLLKNKEVPIDIVIDLSLIPKEDLEENIETWAYLIMMTRNLENVNFIFEHPYSQEGEELSSELANDLENAASAVEAVTALKATIEEKALSIGLEREVKDVIKARINAGRRQGAVEVPIISKAWLEWLRRTKVKGSELKENQYPIALEGFTLVGEDVALRNFEAALTIGLTKAALVIARDKGELSEVIAEGKLLDRLNELYGSMPFDREI